MADHEEAHFSIYRWTKTPHTHALLNKSQSQLSAVGNCPQGPAWAPYLVRRPRRELPHVKATKIRKCQECQEKNVSPEKKKSASSAAASCWARRFLLRGPLPQSAMSYKMRKKRWKYNWKQWIPILIVGFNINWKNSIRFCGTTTEIWDTKSFTFNLTNWDFF